MSVIGAEMQCSALLRCLPSRLIFPREAFIHSQLYVYLCVMKIKYLHFVYTWQVCRAYEQFMIDLATLIRTDRKLVIDENRIKEEVTRVMDLERDIANVSTHTLNIYSVCVWVLYCSIRTYS